MTHLETGQVVVRKQSGSHFKISGIFSNAAGTELVHLERVEEGKRHPLRDLLPVREFPEKYEVAKSAE